MGLQRKLVQRNPLTKGVLKGGPSRVSRRSRWNSGSGSSVWARDGGVLLYSLPDPLKRKLFVALCRRYGLKPYRQPGRRYVLPAC